MVLILLGDVYTRLRRTQLHIIAQSRCQHQLALFHGALNRKPPLSRHSKFLLSTYSGRMVLMVISYTAYPHSVLGNNRASSGTLPSAHAKLSVDAGAPPARHATHIKIESPSVTAAAKKAATDNAVAETADADSSTTSDEDTLVCKSKSIKSFGADDVVISPTKSKL